MTCVRPDIPLLYLDNHLVAVIKPAGLPVQPDASTDNDLLSIITAFLKQRFGKPGNVYLGMVQRLDRPVSGVMLFARTSKAAARLIKECSSGNGSRKDISAAVKRASHAVCIELKRIKDLNRGFLPDADLKELWDRFSCGDAFAELDLG